MNSKKYSPLPGEESPSNMLSPSRASDMYKDETNLVALENINEDQDETCSISAASKMTRVRLNVESCEPKPPNLKIDNTSEAITCINCRNWNDYYRLGSYTTNESTDDSSADLIEFIENSQNGSETINNDDFQQNIDANDCNDDPLENLTDFIENDQDVSETINTDDLLQNIVANDCNKKGEESKPRFAKKRRKNQSIEELCKIFNPFEKQNKLKGPARFTLQPETFFIRDYWTKSKPAVKSIPIGGPTPLFKKKNS